MNIRLEIEGSQGRTSVELKPFTLELGKGVLRVTTPMFDDWHQSAYYDLLSAGVQIYSQAGGLVFRFPTAAVHDQFKAWLAEANAKAEKGYKTMWP